MSGPGTYREYSFFFCVITIGAGQSALKTGPFCDILSGTCPYFLILAGKKKGPVLLLNRALKINEEKPTAFSAHHSYSGQRLRFY